MTEGKERPPDVSKEFERQRRFNVATINPPFETVEELRVLVESLGQGEPIDTIIAKEFAMKVEYAIEHLDELREVARTANADVIVAPDNYHQGTNVRYNWREIKEMSCNAGAQTEEGNFPEDCPPESVGLFIRKNGWVFIFPKSGISCSRNVHRIPDSKIGISICSEILSVRPEELDGIDILYNPSEEYDDIFVWLRMAQTKKGSPLTRQEVEGLLKKDVGNQSFLLNEEDYLRYAQKRRDNLQQQLDKHYFDLMYGDRPLVNEGETLEKRREQFDKLIDDVIKELAKDDNSFYVKKADGLIQALRERKIVVIRSDGMQNSGILNKVPGMKIDELDIQPNATRISVSV